MSSFSFDAELRTDKGKGASRRLRHANKVPGIIYGGTAEPQSVAIESRLIARAEQEESFYSTIINLNVDGAAVEVVLKAVQRHPSKNDIMHLDFMRVQDDHKIVKSVPLHFVNEKGNSILKAGGILTRLATQIEISCLPKDLPTAIDVDVASLDAVKTLHIADLTLPEGVSSVDLARGAEHDQALARIQMPRGAKK